MRGKIRDKHSYTKHDSFDTHEEDEQRRPHKRDFRPQLWDNQQLEDDEVDDVIEDVQMDDEMEENAEMVVKLSNKK
jgi:hypothetical protein